MLFPSAERVVMSGGEGLCWMRVALEREKMVLAERDIGGGDVAEGERVRVRLVQLGLWR